MKGASFGHQIGLKGFGLFTHNSTRLGQMHLKPRTLGHAILPGAAQADYRIHDVFPGASAALVAGFPGMVDKQNGDSSAAQVQQPGLHGLP